MPPTALPAILATTQRADGTNAFVRTSTIQHAVPHTIAAGLATSHRRVDVQRLVVIALCHFVVAAAEESDFAKDADVAARAAAWSGARAARGGVAVVVAAAPEEEGG